MKCWDCGQEMEIEFDNPWRKNKYGDKIRTTTYVCWACQNIIKLNATDVKIDDIRNDDSTA